MMHDHASGRRAATDDPERRLLAAVVLRAARDLALANPRLRGQAVDFFDEEGVALAATLGIPAGRVRQRLAEVTDE